MQEQFVSVETAGLRKVPASYPSQTNEFGEILDYFGLEYKPVENYLQVGEIPWVQGWILHISVIAFECNALLEVLVPVLMEEKVAFKVVRDRSSANDLLFGYRGYTQLAKLVSIYPENGVKASLLAKRLITLTEGFRGPAIPTDLHLGGCVYTRYGGGNHMMAMDASGKPVKLIQDTKGQWVPDPYTIPFTMPAAIRWPFDTIVAPKTPPVKKTLYGKYRLVSMLKADPRGSVWKAVYLKKWLFTDACVIKEGKRGMCADSKGLDIRGRLLWQAELHRELEGIVPLPKILDCFEEDGNTYLAMEFIKGISVYEFKGLINGNCLGWRDLTVKQKLAVIDFLLKIIGILQVLHARGIVHRDITPVNFLIDKDQQIFLIDIELAYSLVNGRPNPPFGFGSPGYMSPEQIAESVPTVKEDIYGLSATILNLLVGLSPVHFCIENQPKLVENLEFFIGDTEIAGMIAKGLDPNLLLRPELGEIKAKMEAFREGVVNAEKFSPKVVQVSASEQVPIDNRLQIDPDRLRSVIQTGIDSLVQPPTVIWEGLWLSRSLETGGKMDAYQRDYALYPGLHDGIAGVLYFLGRAKLAGFSIDACMESYRKGWSFLQNNFLNKLPNIPPGLYSGAAGIAVAFAAGIRAGLLSDTANNRQLIRQCLDLEPVGLDLAMGMAGQGVATLRCSDYLPEDVTKTLLGRSVRLLLKQQQKDGSWLLAPLAEEQKPQKRSGFGQGAGGITWFLLDYLARYPDAEVKPVVGKALAWLEGQMAALKKISKKADAAGSSNQGMIAEGAAGNLLVFIKGYEVLQDPKYKSIVEKTLLREPAFPLNNDFSQTIGLAGLGELYQEATRVFGSDPWAARVAALANNFLHTVVEPVPGSGYWLKDQTAVPLPVLMEGNTGILHYLLRCQTHEVDYRLLH